MKSSFEIQNILYRLLNVASITNAIDGEIHKGHVPAGSQKQDVEINVLANENKYLQTGFINVNFYCKQIQENAANFKKLDEVNLLLMGLIDGKQAENVNLQVEQQTGPHKDKEPGRDGMYYTNLKIKFNTL